jgi:hypothetical protein
LPVARLGAACPQTPGDTKEQMKKGVSFAMQC